MQKIVKLNIKFTIDFVCNMKFSFLSSELFLSFVYYVVYIKLVLETVFKSFWGC